LLLGEKRPSGGRLSLWVVAGAAVGGPVGAVVGGVAGATVAAPGGPLDPGYCYVRDRNGNIRMDRNGQPRVTRC